MNNDKVLHGMILCNRNFLLAPRLPERGGFSRVFRGGKKFKKPATDLKPMYAQVVGLHGIKGTTLYDVFDSRKGESTVRKAVKDGELQNISLISTYQLD